MTSRRLGWLIVAGSLIAVPATAQVAPVVAAPPRVDTLERVLDWIEDNPVLRLITREHGLGIRVGGIEGGAGFATGPRWRTTRPLNGLLELSASTAVSISRDRGVELGAILHEVGTPRLSLRLGVTDDVLAAERFFGTGRHSLRTDESVFTLQRRVAGLETTLAATRWLRLTGGARLATMAAGTGTAPGVPGIAARFDTGGLPGFGTPTAFSILSLGVAADRRDVPGNPRRGGRYAVRVDRYVDRSVSRASFNRVEVDLEQHLSWWRGQRLLTVRANAVVSDANPGQEVPFYLMPTLGGAERLRGFVTDRFRDRHRLVLQAEYAWDIWPFLNAVLFYETGHVARRVQDLTFANLQQDYGIGFRLGSARTIALRTDVAFGSGEGTRISMRFSHAF
jgi:hypothetical protein